jgi:NTE family protein
MKGPAEVPADAKVIDLVIQGSGIKAVAALGAVMTLHDAGYHFARISGTSSGALVAALVTAYQSAGKDLHDLADIMKSLDPAKFEKAPVPERVTGLVGETWEALLRGGAYDGRYLRDWLARLLEATGITRFGDLRVSDPGSSLPESQSYSVVVHAADISRRCWLRLPWDYPEYGMKADDQLIADAVAASMAFPVVFEPVHVTTGTGETVTWVDGGLMADYPLTVFDRTDGRPSRWPTWGIRLFGEPAGNSRAVRSVPDIIVSSLQTLLEWNRYGLDEEGPSRKTIDVNTGPDNVANELNLRISAEGRAALYQQGQQAAARFLDQLATAVA